MTGWRYCCPDCGSVSLKPRSGKPQGRNPMIEPNKKYRCDYCGSCCNRRFDKKLGKLEGETGNTRAAFDYSE